MNMEYEFVLEEEKLKKLIQMNDIEPSCGAREVGIDVLQQYFEMLDDEYIDLDVLSLVECLNEDLIHFHEKELRHDKRICN